MSPWRWPQANVDRLLTESKKHRRELLDTVARLDEFVEALNAQTQRIEKKHDEGDDA